MGDPFGHGVLRRSNPPGERSGVKLEVYRAYPYTEDLNPQRIPVDQFEQRIPPVDILPLDKPDETLQPLAGCTLSGRYLYGERRYGEERSIVLRTCVDYLP